MVERIITQPVNSTPICKDCSCGKEQIQEIIVNGHENINVYLRALLNLRPGEMLPTICVRPRTGMCPPKGQDNI